jgi:phosphate transport system permease protein
MSAAPRRDDAAPRFPALADRGYRTVVAAGAAAVPLLLAGAAWALARGGLPTFGGRGAWDFLARAAWDPVRGTFAVGPALGGTLVTAAIALAVAAPLGLAAAVYTAELAPPRLRAPLAALVDLLAAVPSVVYGLWGLQVLVPAVRRPRRARPPRHARLGPVRGVRRAGVRAERARRVARARGDGAAVRGRRVARGAARRARRAARGRARLGATPWEAAVDVVLPHARAGVAGAVLLGLGRALGETMAVAMVVGAAHRGPGRCSPRATRSPRCSPTSSPRRATTGTSPPWWPPGSPCSS